MGRRSLVTFTLYYCYYLRHLVLTDRPCFSQQPSERDQLSADTDMLQPYIHHEEARHRSSRGAGQHHQRHRQPRHQHHHHRRRPRHHRRRQPRDHRRRRRHNRHSSRLRAVRRTRAVVAAVRRSVVPVSAARSRRQGLREK